VLIVVLILAITGTTTYFLWPKSHATAVVINPAVVPPPSQVVPLNPPIVPAATNPPVQTPATKPAPVPAAVPVPVVVPPPAAVGFTGPASLVPLVGKKVLLTNAHRQNLQLSDANALGHSPNKGAWETWTLEPVPENPGFVYINSSAFPSNRLGFGLVTTAITAADFPVNSTPFSTTQLVSGQKTDNGVVVSTNRTRAEQWKPEPVPGDPNKVFFVSSLAAAQLSQSPEGKVGLSTNRAAWEQWVPVLV
jgi:hypothetical protein